MPEHALIEKRNFCNPKNKPQYNSSSSYGLQKLHSVQYGIKLEGYYNEKFGQVVTPIAMLKTLAVISSTFKNNIKLWILHVAPSRHLKSQTTNEQREIFTKKRWVYAGSDFTIHGLNKDYGSGKRINNKCLIINDLTLLLASKAKQTKARLIDALSELNSEGQYIYSNFEKKFEIKARFSLIANITPLSFLRNRNSLLGNTFTERCLVVYHELTEEEMSDANINRKERDSMNFKKFETTLNEGDVRITREDLVRFDEYAKRWRIIGAYSSSSALFDMIKSIAVAYAILSDHKKITKSEYRFLEMLEPCLHNPNESMKLEILRLAHQGRTIRDICKILDKDYRSYRPFVSKTLSEYRRRGVLPSKISSEASQELKKSRIELLYNK